MEASINQRKNQFTYVLYTDQLSVITDQLSVIYQSKLFVCEITQRIKHFTNDQKH